MVYDILLFAGVGFNILAQFLLKRGMSQVGLIALDSGFLWKMKSMLLNPYFVGGILSYGVGFLVYSIVLSKLELSKAYPVSSVTAILAITLIGVIFLNERISVYKGLGISLCVLGIVIIFSKG